MKRSATAAADRVYSIKLHLRYLQSIAANPSTVDVEIARRESEIAKHQAAISRMRHLKENVHEAIEAKEVELRQAAMIANQNTLATKIAKFQDMQRQLKEIQRRMLHAYTKP